MTVLVSHKIIFTSLFSGIVSTFSFLPPEVNCFGVLTPTECTIKSRENSYVIMKTSLSLAIQPFQYNSNFVVSRFVILTLWLPPYFCDS